MSHFILKQGEGRVCAFLNTIHPRPLKKALAHTCHAAMYAFTVCFMSGEKILQELATDGDIALEMTTGLLRVAVESVPMELRNLSTSELEQMRQPSPTDYALRQSFWAAIEKAKSNGEPHIRISQVYNNICSKQSFHQTCENHVRMAFILNRPKDDLGRLRDILQVAIGRFETYIATAPINEKSAGHYMKAMELLMNRVHGPMVQRIEAKHAHIKVPAPVQSEETKDVNKRLEELKSKLISAPPQQEIIPQQTQYDTIEVTANEQRDSG
jgi:hypothetical protein